MTGSQLAGSHSELGPDAYTRWRASEIGAITERLERRLILELAGDVHGRTVLDVGCGDGDLALELANLGATVTGIGSSVAMIRAARMWTKQHGADIVFQVANAERLPFRPEQFDIVTAITILCFVADAHPALQEIARVLKPGGRLVIGELGKWSPWAAGRRIARGSARHYGAKEGSAQPMSFAISPSRPTSSSRLCAGPSITPAGLRRRAG